jgi:uncharacterized protein (TIGR02757 family)
LPRDPLARALDRIYNRYNRRELVDTDPLGHVYRFTDGANREIVGLLAAALAFGKVEQIRRSLDRLLDRLGAPAACLENTGRRELEERLDGFRHRFVTGKDVADLLEGVRRLVGRWGSLNRYYVAHCRGPGREPLEAAGRLAEGLGAARTRPNYLVPLPARGSACKRLHLYLRWMVRRDDVDPGVWEGVPASELMIPLDTHMHRICGRLGLVRRRQADGRAVREASDAFRTICPDDPVRYDFALTRIGMAGRHDELPQRPS